MLKNYLLVALRNIKKNKLYSFINIFGLTIGLSAGLLIGMYVVDELSYDRFHENVEDIYRISLHGKISGQEIVTSRSSPPIAQALINEAPGVEAATRVRTIGDIVFRNGDDSFVEEQVIYADSNFFEFFTFRLVEGDPHTVLAEPNTVVFTSELANKYFPDGNAIGRFLSVGSQKREYKITGIAEKPPENSHIKFKAILSQRTVESEQFYSGWTNNFLFTYFRKNKNTSIEDIDSRLVEMVQKYVGEELQQFMGVTFEQFLEQGNAYGYISYPMTDTHLRSITDDDMEANGDITYVYIFSGIGLFILFIACINFMNLSTARSAGRAKEVGMRKTFGSYRHTLIGQFLLESILYSIFATVLAIIITYLILPQFNLIAGKNLVFSGFLTPSFFVIMAAVALFVGLLAGSYPAFYLTAFKPAEVLRGKGMAGMKSSAVRSSLVVFQFWVSIVLIICTTVIYKQLSYMQNKNLGLDKQNVLIISSTGKLDTDIMPFKNAIESNSNVVATSFTNNVFPGVNNTTVFKNVLNDQDHMLGSYFADYDHADVLNFEIVEGRFFSRDFPSDSLAVVINEAAVKEFGWEKGVNNEILNFFDDSPAKTKVIGVVKDFNFESLKTNIRPMVINLTNTSNNLLVRYHGDAAEIVSVTETIWKEFAPGEPFEYEFLDQSYDKLFRAEQRLGKLFSMFTVLAIFIASLGLFALSSFMAEQRTKEIGIRKVLGASMGNLTALLSKEFTKLVLISFILAVLPSWYFMGKWLDGFVYRDQMGVWVFFGAGALALTISWLTVSYQALKAAMSNPVDSLKYE